MKKNLLLYVLTALLICLTCGVGKAQFVKLNGKQFVDSNGQPFFPLVMNYRAQIAYDGNPTPDSSDFKAIRSPAYGTRADTANILEGCTWANCDSSIDCDFKKIKEMGFNTVRLILSAYKIGANERGFYARCDEVPNIGGVHAGMLFNDPFSTAPPPVPYIDTTGSEMEIFLNIIAHVMDLANKDSLKIIYLCSDAFGKTNDRGSNDTIAIDYASFLSLLASHLKDKPALLAYDLYNEPGVGNNIQDHNLTKQKQKVCEYVSMWYDSIKAVDPNHLITLGGGYPGDAMYWDDHIMKLDFVSMHPYPDEQDFENYDPVKATNRVLDAIYWCSNTLQRPWIIGETGFTAAPDACLVQPWTQGSLTDQYNYVAAVLPAVRDCGGSGFSWWEFMDAHMGGVVPRDVCDSCHDCLMCDSCSGSDTSGVSGNYFGLLEYSDPDPITHLYDTLYDKPAVKLFQSFNPFLTGGTCAAPTAQYYNPYLFPSNPHSVTGLVQDQNGNVLQNAVVGYFSSYKISGGIYNNTFSSAYYSVYTSANTTNNFSCIPFNPTTSDSNYTKHNSVFDIQISAVGAERLNWGSYGGDSIPIPSNNDLMVTLHQFPLDYDVSMNGIALDSGTQNFNGWNTLTASNDSILSGGTSDITARSEIHITGEFHAATGSEVHIFTSSTFPDCNDYITSSAFQMQNRVADGSNGKREIDLTFLKPGIENTISVIPNPSNGRFLVQLNTSDNSSYIQYLSVYDITGRTVYASKESALSVNLDLTSYSKSVYFIKAIDSINKSYNQKIILQ